MIVYGVDPGVKGGIARILLDMHQQQLVITSPMPEDLRDFGAYFSGALGAIHVFVEKAQSFPGQGIASAFNYGRHFGELLGVLNAGIIPHTLVHPRVWTKAMHTGTNIADPKKRSLEAARRLFPGHDFKATMRCKKPHDGMVDAALIALYGWRKLLGKE